MVACDLPSSVSPSASADPGSGYVFDPGNLLLYELFIPSEEWQVLCENARDHAVAAKEGGDTKRAFTPTFAQALLRVSDEEMPQCVGVRLRGETTLERLFFTNSDDDDPGPEYQECLVESFVYKPSFKIALDEFARGQRFHDQEHLSLGGYEGGESHLRDYLVAGLAEEFDVPSPRVSHGLVCINGVFRGVFTVQEEHDDQAFLDHHFPDAADGNYYKVRKWGPLTFHEGEDMDKYRELHYEPAAGTSQDEAGHEIPYTEETDLIRMLRFANFRDPERFAAEIDEVAAVDAWLRLIAMEMTIPDADGMFPDLHNYTLYHHPKEGWWPVRYDWDRSFTDARVAVEDRATRDRLFDLVPDYNEPANNPPNRCDGRPVFEDDDCPGPCSGREVRHPVLPARILHTRTSDYLDRVEQFLTDVFVPADVQATIDARSAFLEDAYRGDPWSPFDDWEDDVAQLREDVERLHADSLLALQDARGNPAGVAPAGDREQMIQWCGERSCWPYACP